MEEQADLFKNPSPVVPNSPERKSVVLSLSSNTNEEV
jgi:tetratricopeptide (TPR) repeat protein